jgi:hypothetical protein
MSLSPERNTRETDPTSRDTPPDDDPRSDEFGRPPSELEPDFTDAPGLSDPHSAVGPVGNAEDGAMDLAGESGEVYTPPIDPVVTTDAHGQTSVLGGFSLSSTDDIEVDRSVSDGRLGDEAIAEAIERELREDAATTNLDIRAEVRQGVARLRGFVAGPEDVEMAESVAGRVPGVIEVVEELRVRQR